MKLTAIVNTVVSVATRDVYFPDKLHKVLVDLEVSGLSHIASYLPHGRAFRVHKPREFVSSVLPLYFRQSKYTSFQRQLSIYGFRRITAGPDKHAYFHEMFLREQPLLAGGMMRMKVKGKGPRRPASPSTAPNFYAVTPLQLSAPAVSAPSSVATVAEQAVTSAAPVVEELNEMPQQLALGQNPFGTLTVSPASQINGADLSLLPSSSSLTKYPWCQNHRSPQEPTGSNRVGRGDRSGTGNPPQHSTFSLATQPMDPLALPVSIHDTRSNLPTVGSEVGPSNPTLWLGVEQLLLHRLRQRMAIGGGSVLTQRQSFQDDINSRHISYPPLPTPVIPLAMQIYGSIGRSDDQAGRSTRCEGNQTFNGAFLGTWNGL